MTTSTTEPMPRRPKPRRLPKSQRRKRESRFYSEGRLAAIMDTRCPYVDNYRSGQWFAGYRYERDLMQIRGQIAAVEDCVEDELGWIGPASSAGGE